MATLKHIRKRIKSVKNTQKITKAMKMVAAAKLRRAQQAIVAARPYAIEIGKLLVAVTASDLDPESLPPLLKPKPVFKKTALVLFTSDRGLCGAFNSSIVRMAVAFIAEERRAGREVELVVYGRKGRDALTARGYALAQAETDIGKWTLEDHRRHLAALVTRYESGEVDRVVLLYNRFLSAISQEVTLKPVLPAQAANDRQQASPDSPSEPMADYKYEPNRVAFLSTLVDRVLFSSFYTAYLESLASELGARMSAMDSATNNASEMIRKLTLAYNRARQAAITLELMDIVNGAESIA